MDFQLVLTALLFAAKLFKKDQLIKDADLQLLENKKLNIKINRSLKTEPKTTEPKKTPTLPVSPTKSDKQTQIEKQFVPILGLN